MSSLAPSYLMKAPGNICGASTCIYVGRGVVQSIATHFIVPPNSTYAALGLDRQLLMGSGDHLLTANLRSQKLGQWPKSNLWTLHGPYKIF